MTILFDDDVFDAQLKVEQVGHAFFDKELLAKFLGVRPNTLTKYMQTGKVPRPDHYLEEHGTWDVPNPGLFRKAIWTCDQVVQMLVNGD